MALVLTDRQVVAAAAECRFSNIISAPGSGKTTVSAERFGYLHHRGHPVRRGVLGLSFNRAAVSELRTRISARWGQATTRPPNLVTTFDDLHVRVLEHLLRSDLVAWPAGHRSLEVLDDYQGKKGFRFLPPGSWRRRATCDERGQVVSDSYRLTVPANGIGSVEHHRTVLSDATPSHEDVRWVLRAAAGRLPDVRPAIEDWFRHQFFHLVIDEVYDADELDLWMAECAAAAGPGLTIVGDPRQALYGWRGATPEKVQILLDSFPFQEFDQPESFRFRGLQMPQLAQDLRTGAPVALPPGSSVDVDVALARRWASLWQLGDNVLPLAFRTVSNGIDAMLNLLLDEVTRRRLGRASFGRQSSYVLLGLNPSITGSIQSQTLDPIVRAMVEGRSAPDILKLLRDAAAELGASRRPNRLSKANELIRQHEVEALRTRLLRTDLVPGLTVHQAKGCEWNRVGVGLTNHDRTALARGLVPLAPEDCVLYVALTRARSSCISLGDPEQLTLPSG